MSVMWNALRAEDNRRNELLSLLGSQGMGVDLFERYCGGSKEMMLFVNLGLVEIKNKHVHITKNGKQRLAAHGVTARIDVSGDDHRLVDHR